MCRGVVFSTYNLPSPWFLKNCPEDESLSNSATSAPGPDGPFLRRRSNNLPPEEIKQGRTDHFCAHFTTFVLLYNLQPFSQKSD